MDRFVAENEKTIKVPIAVSTEQITLISVFKNAKA